jgi:hypothetical protein
MIFDDLFFHDEDDSDHYRHIYIYSHIMSGPPVFAGDNDCVQIPQRSALQGRGHQELSVDRW